MSKVTKTMELISRTRNNVNDFYDMDACNIQEIYNNSANTFDLICNAFIFGYAQGTKATKAKLRKGI